MKPRSNSKDPEERRLFLIHFNAYRTLQTHKRREVVRRATPSWLSQEHHAAIKAFYLEAAKQTELTGKAYHVDHQIPLRGRDVCGLHVPWNLQVLEAKENLKKSANF